MTKLNPFCFSYHLLANFPVDGQWSNWSNWGPCSKTCNYGVRTRSRTCNNPAPAHGGKPCQGDANHQESCNLQKCPLGKCQTHPSFYYITSWYVINISELIWTIWSTYTLYINSSIFWRRRRNRGRYSRIPKTLALLLQIIIYRTLIFQWTVILCKKNNNDLLTTNLEL